MSSLSQAFTVGQSASVPQDFAGELASLPPFLRVLLTTDGTVTSSLQAFFWEQIAVETLSQAETVLEEDCVAIDAHRGDHVTLRQVQLRGCDSGNIYVQAKSLIRLDVLPQTLVDAIVARKLGVGELLRDCGLESYRQILAMGHEDSAQSVWRSYRIAIASQPFIHITEHFPLRLYR